MNLTSEQQVLVDLTFLAIVEDSPDSFEAYYELNHGNRLVDSYVECDRFACRPVLDVAASLGEDGRTLTVSAVNWSQDQEIETRIQLLPGATHFTEIREHVLRGKNGLHSYNDWDHPEDVSVEYREGKLKSGPVVHSFPPQSVTTLQFVS